MRDESLGPRMMDDRSRQRLSFGCVVCRRTMPEGGRFVSSVEVLDFPVVGRGPRPSNHVV